MNTTRRLPSLKVLRAFQVAGRHLSFKLAADELCITASAVSHQIKNLSPSSKGGRGKLHFSRLLRIPRVF